MCGTQALHSFQQVQSEFENDVNVYGTQAPERNEGTQLRFENDVNMYGTQANPLCLVVSRPV